MITKRTLTLSAVAAGDATDIGGDIIMSRRGASRAAERVGVPPRRIERAEAHHDFLISIGCDSQIAVTGMVNLIIGVEDTSEYLGDADYE